MDPEKPVVSLWPRIPKLGKPRPRLSAWPRNPNWWPRNPQNLICGLEIFFGGLGTLIRSFLGHGDRKVRTDGLETQNPEK